MDPSRCPDEHDRIFDDVLSSDDELRSAFEASPLRDCPRCRARLDGLVATSARLDAAFVPVRADLAAAPNDVPEEDTPGLAHLRATLTGRPPAKPSHGPRGLWIRVAAAAAVLLGLVLLLKERNVTDPDYGVDPTTTMGGKVAVQHPVGPVDEYAPFEWDGSLSPGTAFFVRIYTTDGTLLVESGPLSATRWEPDEAGSWPDEIDWVIEVRGTASGSDLRTREGPIRATRRR